MNADEREAPNQWSRLEDFFQNQKQVKFILLSIVLIVTIVLSITAWNGRYSAGYRAGAGTGEIYEQQFKEQKKEINNLQRTIDEQDDTIRRLTGQAERLKAKEGLFSPKVSQSEIEDMKQAAEFKLRQAEQIRSEAISEAENIGAIKNQVENCLLRVKELSEEKGISNRNFWISLIINVALGVSLFLVGMFLFLERYGIIRPNTFSSSISRQQTLTISPIKEENSKNILKNSQNDDLRSLPSGEPNDET